jgi:hypothetical protein
MRARRIIRIVVVCYVVFCSILAIFLGELAFRPHQAPVTKRHSYEAAGARFGAPLQDVSISASDGSHLQGWLRVQPNRSRIIEGQSH